MATYASLSQEDKDLCDAYVSQLRAYAGQVNRLLSTGATLQAMASAGAQAVIDSLDAGATIPNTSGLAGAQTLTKEDVNTISTDNDTALATFGTAAKKSLQVKAAGVNAIT